MTIARPRLRYAAEVFLSEMRAQFAALHPGEQNPIKTLAEYPPEHQSAVMRAAAKVLTSATKEADPYFQTWLSKQPENQ